MNRFWDAYCRALFQILFRPTLLDLIIGAALTAAFMWVLS